MYCCISDITPHNSEGDFRNYPFIGFARPRVVPPPNKPLIHSPQRPPIKQSFKVLPIFCVGVRTNDTSSKE